MLKKSFLMLFLLCLALPAYAWQLQVQAANPGGTITITTAGADILAVNGKPVTAKSSHVVRRVDKTVSLTIKDGANATAAVAGDGIGYTVSKVVKNGQNVPLAASYTFTANGLGQKLGAWFKMVTTDVTAVAEKGGTISPRGTKPVQKGLIKTYLIKPGKGSNVEGVAAVPEAALTSLVYQDGTGAATLPSSKPVIANVTVGDIPITLTASFQALRITAGDPQTVTPSTAVTLNATALRGIPAFWTWRQLSGPKATLATPSGKPHQATFTPTVLGTYKFQATATEPKAGGGVYTATAITYVSVVDDVADAVSQTCLKCHTQRGVGGGTSPTGVFELWKASAHKASTLKTVMCYDCHIGVASGNHPGVTPTSATCRSCHNAEGVAAAFNHSPDFNGDCLLCHDAHSLQPHPEMSTVAGCIGCHSTYNPEIYAEWQSGAHGHATGHTTGTCQRCHATEGAVAAAERGWTGSYTFLRDNSTTLWGTSTASTPAQPVSTNGISCAACHTHDSPDTNAKLRPINTYDGSTVVGWNPNQNSINYDQYDVCTSCHTLTDNTGVIVGNYHDGSSASIERTITDSHYDNPATGVGLTTNLIEGYVVRSTSANPCADCHNLHTADLTIQEQWASSAHAGGIADYKYDVVCATSLLYYAATPEKKCTDIRPGSSRSYYNDYIRTTTAASNGTQPATVVARAAGVKDETIGNAWAHYNWDQTSSRGSCQRCHTSTGAANFLTNPATYNAAGTGNNFSHLSGWTSASGSPQNELLYCWGCHSDAQTGALRNPGAITENYAAATTGGPVVTVTYPDVAASNVCMGCHLGREVGANVATDTDSDGVRSFINSHYLTAGSTLFGESGYEYSGQTYPAGFHRNVGVNNAYGTGTAGPCVTCHMTGAESHSFEVLTAAGAPATEQCAKCHTGLDKAALDEARETFEDALHELQAALEFRGIYYYPAHPYFYKGANGTGGAFTDWEGAVTVGGSSANSNWKQTMGAAFNYNVLHHDPGAYAHNRQYALKLIADSIDFLADGSVNGAGLFLVSGSTQNYLGTVKEEGATGSHVAFDTTNPVACNTCHTSGLPGAPGGTKASAAAHAVTGVLTIGDATVTASDSDLQISYNIKVDGVNSAAYDTIYRVYRIYYDAGTSAWKRDQLTVTGFTLDTSDSANGNYTITIPGGVTSYGAVNSNYMVAISDNTYTGTQAPRGYTVGSYPTNPKTYQVSSQACINCHGEKGTGFHNANPVKVDNCINCHAALTGAKEFPTMIHGIHNSYNMPSGYTFSSSYKWTDVTFPTYMNNCSVCHVGSQLTNVNTAPVSYKLCMSCHGDWTGFGHVDMAALSQDHTGYTSSTDCTTCHAGDDVTDFHNGLTTERGGLIVNGQDFSVVEGAKTVATINKVSRSGNNLVVEWTATYDGDPVDPCFGPSTSETPKPSWKNGTGAFSILRAWGEKDDWTNVGITAANGTASPGQPQSTNLTFGTNTVCAGKVATSTIPLLASELAKAAGTKLGVALQGKPSIYSSYLSATTTIRAKNPIKSVTFRTDNGEMVANDRREVVDSDSCLKCHVGSMYQHGGNRVDNINFCVMCHNEASTEQNVRLLDGVDKTEAYDGKVGQTYGFKSFLHAVHSAGKNEAVTMCYRTNGNYVWAGHSSVIPNYPAQDVFADDFRYTTNYWVNDDPTKTEAVGHGMAALIYGSSAPHGTGPQTAGTSAPPVFSSASTNANYNPAYPSGTSYTAGTSYMVYRAHNLHHTTYPQVLNNCAACHKPGTFGFPDPTKAVGTTVDAGTVNLSGTAPNQSAAGTLNNVQTDDTLQGPSAAACFSCHQGEMAPAPFHGNIGGFEPAVFSDGRAGVPAETCAGCHNN